MTRIVSVAPVVPERRHEQAEITAMLLDLVAGEHPLAPDRRALMERLHRNCGVRARHLALPLERYAELDGFTGANDAFLEVGVQLGTRAVREALERVGLAPEDVDVVLSTTVTGVAAPSLEARMVAPLGLRPDVKRIPVFGLGCVAGAAGVARLHDHLVGHPDDVAVLLSVELCSLTVQRDDASTANLVASGLFGDGAAAVVLLGERRAAALGLPGPQVVTSRSRFYPDTADVMGWDVGGSGFRIVLSKSVADVVEDHLADDLKGFLAAADLDRADVARWVAHPGGPKVLEAVQRTLELPAGALRHSWESLAATGNLSSSSVLHVLAATLADPPPPAGSHGVLLAMGPGFCAELVLLRWDERAVRATAGAGAGTTAGAGAGAGAA
ncbi:type III polyketide synthase [Quadrisphaera sp. DSM 44207]|uniref:type III polyketide synthase n=1 Tax=Quadrisphaera sp. DSM 44207 TaxID=1881057 RepID=UPI0008860B52|nr:3-oxoacyl-[acyl-carrier-protein] synthase III C-terminal domain-containing protein [Quadrisphaera sp. DSM 44207]SDQ65746.1 isopalmitoylresorcinol synthase [Quadrisphaera sp. DSM 44207]